MKQKVLARKCSIPFTQTVKVIKQECKQEAKDGDIVTEKPVVPVPVTNKSGSNCDCVCGRHVPLHHILGEELDRLEQAGFLSKHPWIIRPIVWRIGGTISQDVSWPCFNYRRIPIMHDSKVHSADPALIEKPTVWLLARSVSFIVFSLAHHMEWDWTNSIPFFAVPALILTPFSFITDCSSPSDPAYTFS